MRASAQSSFTVIFSSGRFALSSRKALFMAFSVFSVLISIFRPPYSVIDAAQDSPAGPDMRFRPVFAGTTHFLSPQDSPTHHAIRRLSVFFQTLSVDIARVFFYIITSKSTGVYYFFCF